MRGKMTGMKSLIVMLELELGPTGDISFSGGALRGRRGPVKGPIISPLEVELAVELTRIEWSTIIGPGSARIGWDQGGADASSLIP